MWQQQQLAAQQQTDTRFGGSLSECTFKKNVYGGAFTQAGILDVVSLNPADRTAEPTEAHLRCSCLPIRLVRRINEAFVHQMHEECK